jgi:mannose-6-phosphate isomerase-like protein (cupin superfamily)
MQTGTSFTALDLDGEDRFQRLRNDLGVDSFGLNLLRLSPGARSRIHRHEHQEEVYVVLEGTLTLLVEDEPTEVPRGGLARVAPDVRRQLVNRHPEPLAIIAIGGATPHEGRDGRAYESWEETGEGKSPQEVPFPPDIPVVGSA